MSFFQGITVTLIVVIIGLAIYSGVTINKQNKRIQEYVTAITLMDEVNKTREIQLISCKEYLDNQSEQILQFKLDKETSSKEYNKHIIEITKKYVERKDIIQNKEELEAIHYLVYDFLDNSSRK